MKDVPVALLAIAFALPLLLPVLRPLVRAGSGAVGRPWAWWWAAFVIVLAGGRSGLLQGLGIDPAAVLKWVLLAGFALVVLEDFYHRVLHRPWF
jgi:hypothetical protein